MASDPRRVVIAHPCLANCACQNCAIWLKPTFRTTRVYFRRIFRARQGGGLFAIVGGALPE